MSEKYRDVRASDMHVGTEGDLRVTEQSQLDRIEKKVDRVLELLESKDVSTSNKIDRKEFSKKLDAIFADSCLQLLEDSKRIVSRCN